MTRKLFVLSVVCLLTVSCTNMIHDMVESGKDRKPDQSNYYSPEIQVLPNKRAYDKNQEIQPDHLTVELRQADGTWKQLVWGEFTIEVKGALDLIFHAEGKHTVVVTVLNGVGPGSHVSAEYFVYVGILPEAEPALKGLVVIPRQTAYNPGGVAVEPETHLRVYTSDEYGVMTGPLEYQGGAGFTVSATGTDADNLTFRSNTMGPQTVTVSKDGYSKDYEVWVKPADGQAVYDPEIQVLPGKVGYNANGSIGMTGSPPDLVVKKREPRGNWTTLDYAGGDYSITSIGKLNGLDFMPGVTGPVEITVTSTIRGYAASARYWVHVGVLPPADQTPRLVVFPKVTAYNPGDGVIDPGNDLEVYTRDEYGVMSGQVQYAGGAGYTVSATGTAAGGHAFLPAASETQTVTVSKDGYGDKTYLVWVKPASSAGPDYGPEIMVLSKKIDYNTANSNTITKNDTHLIVQKRKTDSGWETLTADQYTLSAKHDTSSLVINDTNITTGTGFTAAGIYTVTVTANISGYYDGSGNLPQDSYKVYVEVPWAEDDDLVGLVVIPKITVYGYGGESINPQTHVEVYTRDKYGVMTGPAATGYTVSAEDTGPNGLSFLPDTTGKKTVTVTMTGYDDKTYDVWVMPQDLSVLSITPSSVNMTPGSGGLFTINLPPTIGQVDWAIIGSSGANCSRLVPDATGLRNVLLITNNEQGTSNMLKVRVTSRAEPAKFVEAEITLDQFDSNDAEAIVYVDGVGSLYSQTLVGAITSINAVDTIQGGLQERRIQLLKNIDVPAGGIGVIRSVIRLFAADSPKTLKRIAAGTAPIFTVEGGGALRLGGTYLALPPANIILDGGALEGITATAALVNVDGVFTLLDHAILQNNKNESTAIRIPKGGGVSVTGTFIMEGGEICNNESFDGGGVYIRDDDGVFVMSGGSIHNNKAGSSGGYGNRDGGGVYINTGMFFMSGGNISDNEATATGGGVSIGENGGTINMTGGDIYENSANERGGGVNIQRGIFTMMGGKIYGNTAGFGGGVAVNSGFGSGTKTVFAKRGGIIYGADETDPNKKNTATNPYAGDEHAVMIGYTYDTYYRYRENTADAAMRLYIEVDSSGSATTVDPEDGPDADTTANWND